MRITKFLIPLFLLLTALSSCRHSQKRTINQALCLAYSNPDSAINMLNKIDRHSLPNDEKPFYALTYSISQDKSGLDVDNDSLIRIAYDYYNNHNEDSLYGRCLYYMGKYFAITDSLEKASYCLKMAEKYARASKDTMSLCLSLSRLSWTVRKADSKLGLKYSTEAFNIYNKYSHKTIYNAIYYIALECESNELCGNTIKALVLCKEAERMALMLGDSTVISDVYQDLSCLTANISNGSAIGYATLAYKYSRKYNVSKIFALAEAYYNTGKYKKCLDLLDSSRFSIDSDYYTAYNLRHYAALKMRQFGAAISYADSSYKYIEMMYKNEMLRKSKYYEKLMSEKANMVKTETKASMYEIICVLILIISICIIFVSCLIYKYTKMKSETKLAFEKENNKHQKELHAKEMIMTEKLHKEEIFHKEIQLNTMRKYLLNKLEVINKLNKSNKVSNCINLTDEDWDEISIFLENIDNMFVSRIMEQYPLLSDKNIKLLMLIRLKISTKTLALIYGISEKSIKQKLFVFKEKIGIKDRKQSLREFIETF